jgi:hypothetical protein
VTVRLGRIKLWQFPVRAATGAFILNSGIGKRSADEETGARLRDFAAVAFPFFKQVPGDQFAKGLSSGEIALGAALLNPVVPPLLAGGALSAFSGGLLYMYWKSPGMHEEGSVRPTQQGTALAKDIWMFGIGTSLVLDALFSRRKKN